MDVRKDTLDEKLPKIAPILRFFIARIKKVVSLIWRKRIPPTGRRKLNLEESQNKFACQTLDLQRCSLHLGLYDKNSKFMPINIV